MLQTHQIVEGPHQLFVGGNGHKTFGITVRSVEPKTEVEDRGYKRKFQINDYSIARGDLTFLGLSDEEILILKDEIKQLSEIQ